MWKKSEVWVAKHKDKFKEKLLRSLRMKDLECLMRKNNFNKFEMTYILIIQVKYKGKMKDNDENCFS